MDSAQDKAIKRRTIRKGGAFLLAFALAACTRTYTISLSKLDAPLLTEPIRAAIGIYDSKEFLAAEHEWQTGLFRSIYVVGPASISLFDAVFASAFERADKVDSISPPPSAGTFSAVIEPHFKGGKVSSPFQAPLVLKVTLQYEFVITVPNGPTIDPLEVRGEAEMTPSGAITGGIFSASDVAELTERAMRNAAARLLVMLQTREDLRERLTNHAGHIQ